jgi:hypothetical protein
VCANGGLVDVGKDILVVLKLMCALIGLVLVV